MSFLLVYGDHDMALPLQFETHIEEQLVKLIDESIQRAHGKDRSGYDVSSRIVDVVTSMLESNAVPPSEKQIKYAVAIARELNLQIPADVLQRREAMAEFLADHADSYRRTRAR